MPTNLMIADIEHRLETERARTPRVYRWDRPEQRLEMEQLFWCACADYLARTSHRGFVLGTAIATKTWYCTEVVNAAANDAQGIPEAFEQLIRAMLLRLCPRGEGTKMAELHAKLKGHIGDAVAHTTAPTMVTDTDFPLQQDEWTRYRAAMPGRFKSRRVALEHVFHAWLTGHPDPKKWDQFDDLVDELVETWKGNVPG